MTPDELNHLKEAHASATPDPWYFNTSSHHAEIVDDEDDLVLEMGWTARMDAQEHRDGHLLVEARNALPCLLAEIDRLNTRLATAEGRLGRVAASHPEAYLAALEGDEG